MNGSRCDDAVVHAAAMWLVGGVHAAGERNDLWQLTLR